MEWTRTTGLIKGQLGWKFDQSSATPSLTYSLMHTHSPLTSPPESLNLLHHCTTAPLTPSHTHTHASLTPETTPLSSLLLLPFRSVAPLLHQQFFYHLHLFFSLFLLPFFLFFLLFFCVFLLAVGLKFFVE